ncbi:MAG TPA: outer membrane beta-barrel protein [Pseudolabrys sp.]|nr:outer membrane beta-barrel protein [Pseudolabrys sp.]
MAEAADMPRAQPVYKLVPAPLPFAPDWSGLYVGGQFGYGWAHSSGTQDAGGTFFPAVPYTVDSHGVLGGGHAGYNYQIDSMVLGIEGDIEAADIKGLTALTNAGNTFFFNANIGTLASMRGRLGWVRDNWMFYATGGAAFGDISTPPLDNLDGWRTGWTAGAGIERRDLPLFGPQWSTRLEYRYTDFGRATATTASGATDDNKLAMHAIRLGLSYHFNLSR